VASIRSRLTVAYGFALVGNVIIFSAVLALVHNSREMQMAQLGTVAALEADQINSILLEAARKEAPLTEESTCGDENKSVCVAASVDMINLLERVPGYYLVYGTGQHPIYSSVGLRKLPKTDRDALESLARTQTTGEAVVFPVSDRLFGGGLVIVARADSAVGQGITRIVAGAPTTYVEIAPSTVARTLFLVLPFIILVSIGVSYVIAGGAAEPVERLINEVEAITDGRSLHRRLPSDLGNDELSRLGATLNAMIARLETSFGALRRFTADASHELKTPLTVLRADVERAMHPNAASSEKMQALEEALQESARMADLVDSLLTLARADEGRFDLHRETVLLGPLVRDVYETAVILGEDAGQSVTMSVLEEAVVLGDPRRLRQLFLNLITNAIKYTTRGGKVELSLSRRVGGEVTFTVRDTGIGISAADLPNVFDRFWRADRARSRGSERTGFGLGLSISQWIAQAHGGRISAQSRLGRGSVFTVTLPVVTTEVSEKQDGRDRNS
jgi:two-component system OmpR family sensor kinase